MSVRARSYIELAKNKPHLIFHLLLFCVMCYLAYGVWGSLSRVFPEGVELGQVAIVARLLCILGLLGMIVKASNKTVKRALILMVIVSGLEAAEFGCHWMYARELSSSRMAQAEVDRQKVLADSLADKNAQRTATVLDSLSKYNQSQSKLAQSDRELYRTTGQRRTRKVADTPSFEDLGVVTHSQPVARPTPESLMVNGLNSRITQDPPVVETPLSEVQVLAKWTPRFVLAAILALLFTFVGTGIVLAGWEWDVNGNGIADNVEGFGGKA